MPDMFAGRGFSFDLAGTVVGVSKTKPLKHKDPECINVKNPVLEWCIFHMCTV